MIAVVVVIDVLYHVFVMDGGLQVKEIPRQGTTRPSEDVYIVDSLWMP